MYVNRIHGAIDISEHNAKESFLFHCLYRVDAVFGVQFKSNVHKERKKEKIEAEKHKASSTIDRSMGYPEIWFLFECVAFLFSFNLNFRLLKNDEILFSFPCFSFAFAK